MLELKYFASFITEEIILLYDVKYYMAYLLATAILKFLRRPL